MWPPPGLFKGRPHPLGPSPKTLAVSTPAAAITLTPSRPPCSSFSVAASRSLWSRVVASPRGKELRGAVGSCCSASCCRAAFAGALPPRLLAARRQPSPSPPGKVARGFANRLPSFWCRIRSKRCAPAPFSGCAATRRRCAAAPALPPVVSPPLPRLPVKGAPTGQRSPYRSTPPAQIHGSDRVNAPVKGAPTGQPRRIKP
jgi:hypothetical protein